MMEIAELHAWTQDVPTAIALQKTLNQVIQLPAVPVDEIRLVAGADVSATRFSRRIYAAVVVWDLTRNCVVDTAYAEREADFPYIPGLLSFREIPVIVEAFRHLTVVPQAVLADGQGLAHPRNLGLACHLGLWVNLPTVGCAKSRLVGQAAEPGPLPGSFEPLLYREQVVGMVLRTRRGSRPLYISPGHLIDLNSSLRLVNSCLRQRHRLPEPTRLAHLEVNAFRRRCESTL
jgi:deoxyribonuclease V